LNHVSCPSSSPLDPSYQYLSRVFRMLSLFLLQLLA
jgi:hypothetical protein